VHSFEPIMSYLMLALDSKETSEKAIDQPLHCFVRAR